MRGHIWVSLWESKPEQAHWWCKRPDGTILDPSWEQFPFSQAPPAQAYTEFNGTCCCAECGEKFQEGAKGSSYESNYAFCSYGCHKSFVGL